MDGSRQYRLHPGLHPPFEIIPHEAGIHRSRASNSVSSRHGKAYQCPEIKIYRPYLGARRFPQRFHDDPRPGNILIPIGARSWDKGVGEREGWSTRIRAAALAQTARKQVCCIRSEDFSRAV